jgi:undecaprenyl-diphosphatase
MIFVSAATGGPFAHLHAWDTSAFLWLNALHSPVGDLAARFASSPWLLAATHVVLLVALLRGRDWRQFVVLVSLLLLIVLADLAGAHLIKDLVQRPRPSWQPDLAPLIHLVDGRRGGTFGFISTHTAYAFAVATFALLYLRRRGLVALLFAWATAIAYSRIYLGLHFPGDVLGGAIWGTAVAFGVAHAMALVRVRSARQPGRPLLQPQTPADAHPAASAPATTLPSA